MLVVVYYSFFLFLTIFITSFKQKPLLFEWFYLFRLLPYS